MAYYDDVNHGDSLDFKYDSDDDLADRITRLAAQINVATYHFLKMLAEFDSRQGWKKHGVRSCTHWLNWRCSIGYCAAREKIRVAHALAGDKLPQINQAFCAGAVSYSKERAMTRVATNDNELILIDIARDLSATHVERLVQKFQQVDEHQQPIKPLNDYDARQLRYHQDQQGMWVITARLPQVEGGLMIKAIEEVVRQQTPDDFSAKAVSQNRADALSTITEHYIATAKVNGVQSLAGHERCQVVLHLEQDNQHIDGFNVSKNNAERFSCDAQVLSVLREEKYGRVLNLGRNARTVSPALKRALDIRDTSCQFPGCCNNKTVEYHHVKHWSDAGETEPDNLIKLCRFHHDQAHHNHFTIERNGACDQWRFLTMDGKVIPASPDFPPVNDHPLNTNNVNWPQVSSRVGVANMFGAKLNYSKALRDLCRFD